VQLGDGPNIHSWYDQYQDNTESVTTDDVPSLYSVPHKLNSKKTPFKNSSQFDFSVDNRPDSRRSRSASITFDLDDDIHKVNRANSKKRSKEKKEFKQETQANTFAKEESDTMQRSKNSKKESYSFQDQDQELSMWACRKCTLDNPLQEATCLACGGSRLSSIGDIEVPKILEPKNIVNLIVEDTITNTETLTIIPEKIVPNAKWKCIVCTLENDPLAYYCDACNSESPHKMKIELKPAAEKFDLDFKDLSCKFARYFGIACFLAIIVYSLINMTICLYSTAQTIIGLVPDYTPSVEYNPSIKIDTDIQEQIIEEAELKSDAVFIFNLEGVFSHDIFGVKPVMISIFCPVFFYLATRVCNNKVKLAPRVPQPM